MKFKRLALIGCGLMGGSFALAMREQGCVQEITGFSASLATRQRALNLQVIDRACDSIAQAVEGADLVLLAVPVRATDACLQALRTTLSPHALLMDVGSTKGDVVAAARAALGERLPCFVPAHPIAGKEVAGIEHAQATLYQQRKTILTPLPETQAGHVQLAREVWERVGSTVFELSPEAHDATFAAVSHLPHMLAFAAINALLAQPHGHAMMQMGGPGFRDFSRIAASAPAVWRDILLMNQQEVLAQSRHFRAALAQLETAIESQDAAALEQLIEQASVARAAWQLNGLSDANDAA